MEIHSPNPAFADSQHIRFANLLRLDNAGKLAGFDRGKVERFFRRANQVCARHLPRVRDQIMSGSGGTGGYDYQADTFAYVATHAVCQHRLGWFDDFDDTPTAVRSETSGPGDDLGIETLGGTNIEVQAKHGLNRGRKFDQAVQRIIAGLVRDPLLRGVLLVDSTASGPIRDEFRNDVPRLPTVGLTALRNHPRGLAYSPLIGTDFAVFADFASSSQTR